MKAADIWNSGQMPAVSLEPFPDRPQNPAENLGKSIDVLAALTADLVSATFGAGGSKQECSRKPAEKLKSKKRRVINHETEIRLV